MSRARCLLIAVAMLLAPGPAKAGCFLFFCSYPTRVHNHRHPRRIVVIHKTIRKTIIVHEKPAGAPSPEQQISPIK